MHDHWSQNTKYAIKFLLDKDSCNTLSGSDILSGILNSQFVKVSSKYQHRQSSRTNSVFIFSVYNEVFTTERVTLTKNLLYIITRHELREYYGVIYTRL